MKYVSYQKKRIKCLVFGPVGVKIGISHQQSRGLSEGVQELKS